MVTLRERLCPLTSHRLGRVPDAPPGRSHVNFWDKVTGEAVLNWRCACGMRFMSTGRWSGFVVKRPSAEGS